VATDIQQIIRNLTTYYNFKGKTVLHAGAGGGQILDYARSARKVTAVDPDPEAVVRLKVGVVQKGLDKRFTVLNADFMSLQEKGDVVFFEFCLHEMPEPGKALEHARILAPQILVLDHAPDSEWAWHTLETGKVKAAWTAVQQRKPARMKLFQAFQLFKDLDDLVARVKGQGEEAVQRAEKFTGRTDIRIPMPYCIAVL
jgi:ubiquinone/menaquinone biosynthesis C-methylase UbiE